MKSLGQKIQQCEGLLGTSDLSAWEEGFLQGVVERTSKGADTTSLTAKQVDVIEKLHAKHFA